MTCPSAWHGDEPAMPADGLRVCMPCAAGIGSDAIEASRVYVALAARHAGGRAPLGTYVTGSADRRVPYNDRAGDWRTAIRDRLASWASLVRDECRLDPPAVRVPVLAAFVRRHALWLAAHDLAAECVAEIRELAWGPARAAAYPFGARSVDDLAACPHCGGPVRALIPPTGSWLGCVLICTVEPEHRWEAGDWLGVWGGQADEARMSTAMAAVALYGSESAADAVRQHVSRGKLSRGPDGMLSFTEVRELYYTLRGERVDA